MSLIDSVFESDDHEVVLGSNVSDKGRHLEFQKITTRFKNLYRNFMISPPELLYAKTYDIPEMVFL
jgi:hypothetical protein